MWFICDTFFYGIWKVWFLLAYLRALFSIGSVCVSYFNLCTWQGWTNVSTFERDLFPIFFNFAIAALDYRIIVFNNKILKSKPCRLIAPFTHRSRFYFSGMTLNFIFFYGGKNEIHMDSLTCSKNNLCMTSVNLWLKLRLSTFLNILSSWLANRLALSEILWIKNFIERKTVLKHQ